MVNTSQCLKALEIRTHKKILKRILKTEDASGNEMWAGQILNIGETVIRNWEYQWTIEAWCYPAECLIPNGI